jgi:hypothetical protein
MKAVLVPRYYSMTTDPLVITIALTFGMFVVASRHRANWVSS